MLLELQVYVSKQYACLSDKHKETTCISRKTIEDILLYATSCNIHWRSEIGKEQRGEEIQNIDRDINQKFKTFIIYASSNMKSSPEAKTHNLKSSKGKFRLSKSRELSRICRNFPSDELSFGFPPLKANTSSTPKFPTDTWLQSIKDTHTSYFLGGVNSSIDYLVRPGVCPSLDDWVPK